MALKMSQRVEVVDEFEVFIKDKGDPASKQSKEPFFNPKCVFGNAKRVAQERKIEVVTGAESNMTVRTIPTDSNYLGAK